MAQGRRDGGGASRKSEVVTVRFDPKLKYLAELAARKHRRPLSSYIEWAVEQSLSRVSLVEPHGDGEGITVADAERMNHLWDSDEPDRVARLALNYPDLLTHDEQRVWKLIRENGFLWKGNFDGKPAEWTWDVEVASLIWDRLREYWAVFRAVAMGTKSRADLPCWERERVTARTNGPSQDAPKDGNTPTRGGGPTWDAPKGGDLDDEIPF
jgi:hypothetical protein